MAMRADERRSDVKRSLVPSVVGLSRRSALGRAAAVAAALGIGGRLDRAAAQEATPCGPTSWPRSGGRTTPVNGADLYYEVHGPADGHPVLLLHGGLTNAEWWINLSPVLAAAGHRVVAMDSRAHGRSSWGDLPITYEQLAADALGLLDQLGITKADLVGWSDGAITGLRLAIDHADRLDRAVIYGANYTPDGFIAQPQPSDQFPPFERLIADYQRLAPQPERFEELARALFALYAVAPNYGEAELKSIAVPVLILDGAEEEVIKPDQPVRMAALIPGAQLVLMSGTGHYAPFAKPAEFNRIVLAFLAGEPVAATPTA
jgi:pimeloyl-ACP methyl ester carboxylesterase